MSPLLERVLAPDSLRRAWRRVRANRGVAGSDGVTVERFARLLEANLDGLQREVRQGVYRPWPPLRVRSRAGAKERLLEVPAVRDRVLQRAALEVLAPLCERRFAPSSFGYRPGRGVAAAIAAVSRLRRQGRIWVLDADIEDCFGSFDHELMRRFIRELVSDPGLRGLLEGWMTGSGRDRGVPLGSAVSPLLCNVYLHQLDVGLDRQGLRSVRYADDFIVLCPDAAEAARALSVAHGLLREINLRLSLRKTRVVTFEAGFTFLGVEFTSAGHRVLARGQGRPDWLDELPRQ